MMRTCRMCGREKPLEEFSVTTQKYRRHMCRPCYQQHKSAQDKVRYQRNKATHLNNSAVWRIKNRAKHNRIAAAYRARKNNATIPLSYEHELEMDRIYARAEYLTRVTGVLHHVDHIHPLKHPLCCGLHVPWNLQVIPGKLNSKKSNNLTLDTLAGKWVFSKDVDEA